MWRGILKTFWFLGWTKQGLMVESSVAWFVVRATERRAHLVLFFLPARRGWICFSRPTLRKSSRKSRTLSWGKGCVKLSSRESFQALRNTWRITIGSLLRSWRRCCRSYSKDEQNKCTMEKDKLSATLLFSCTFHFMFCFGFGIKHCCVGIFIIYLYPQQMTEYMYYGIEFVASTT